MPTNVVMPQMGESIAEGTIVRWIKKVGDRVDRDEPLFEISTDKVDAEIPSPAAGVLAEIRAKEGETVAGRTSVVAVIGDAPGRDRSAPPAATAATAGRRAGRRARVGPRRRRSAGRPPRVRAAADARGAAVGRGAAPAASRRRVVRKIAAEHGVDIAQHRGLRRRRAA